MAERDPLEPILRQRGMNDALATEQIGKLETKIGHRFRDPSILIRAMTHSSADAEQSSRDNERLEFLGDRVLALLAADTLMTHYPDAEEGGLASRLNALVRKETCASVAGELDLGRFLIMGDAESQSGGREKTAILGDCCEAVMAAIYLDGGLEAARTFFESNWAHLVADMSVAPKDAKTALQEWSQGRGLVPPKYKLVSRTGPDHRPTFEIEVSVDGEDASRASGTNKRLAEQSAAESLLIRLGIWQQGHVT